MAISWTSISGQGVVGFPTAHSNYIYFFNSATFRRYNVVDDTYETLTAAPGNKAGGLATASNGTIAMVTSDGAFICLYYTGTGAWDAAQFGTPSTLSPYGIAAVGTKLYVFGTESYSFDVVSHVWTELAPMPEVRGGQGVVIGVVGSKIYVIGGYLPPPNSASPSFYNRYYDINTDTWSDRLTDAPFNGGNSVFGGTSGIDGHVYVTRANPGLSIYDPLSDTWSEGTTPPSSGVGQFLTSSPYDGNLYLFTNDAARNAYKGTGVNSPPNAPTLTTMANGETVDKAVVNRASHVFSDANPGDSQSAFTIYWRKIGAGVWNSQHVVTPNNWYDFPADSLTVGDYERQVETYDNQGLLGARSNSGYFSVAEAPPVPTFTDPINGQTISTTTYTASISAPSVDASQWRTVKDNAGSPDVSTIYQDSGVVEGVSRSHTFSFPVNNRSEHLQARVRNGGLWSPWADSLNPISFTTPQAPVVSVVPVDLHGSGYSQSLRIDIVNPAPEEDQPAVVYNDVYLSAPGISEWRMGSQIAPNASTYYYIPNSDVVYAARVVAVGDNGATTEGVG